MRLRNRSRLLTVTAVSAATLAGVLPAASAHAAAATRPLAGSQPQWARSSNYAGAVSGRTPVTVQVQLTLRDQAGAEALAAAVSNPRSAAYGHYLSAAQFNARFAPTSGTVAAVESYLRANGFTIADVPGNHRYVEATGTAAQVKRAFGTGLARYRVHGQVLQSVAGTVTVPASLASSVLAVTGLSQTASQPMHVTSGARAVGAATPSADRPTVDAPCSDFWGQHVATMPSAYGRTQFPTGICGYTPEQLESAYGVQGRIATGNDGHGVTVAIIDAYSSPTAASDLNIYSGYFGLPKLKPGQYRQVLAKHFYRQTECQEPSWNLEQSLDLDSVHAMAPAANIVYVGARSCEDSALLDAINKVVNGHLANLVSNSYGDAGEMVPTAEMQAYHAAFLQAAAEGITFNFSSGDYGDELAVTGTPQPDFPAVDPKVTAVGGTSLAVGQANNYLFETGWGNDRSPVAYSNGNPVGYGIAPPGAFYAGAGGGTSHVYAEPSYQRGVVPANLSREYGNGAHRVLPDVSALADPYTGAYFVETVGGQPALGSIGGTSLASPLFTGIEALASQHRSAPIGFANPVLYSLAGTAAFHDVRPPANAVALAFTSSNPASLCYQSCLVTEDHDSSLTTAAGYDNVTGVGSPNGTAFLRAVAR